ncbi:hypothetical protein [Streptomyces sp. NPDC060022]
MKKRTGTSTPVTGGLFEPTAAWQPGSPLIHSMSKQNSAALACQ